MGQTSERLDLNGRCAFLSAGLPSPSSLTRCHLSQSERPWQSAKFPGLESLRPAAARGAVRRCAETFRLCQGLPLWGSWREAPERARMLAARLRPGLAGAYDGADFRKAQSKLTRCVLVSGLALSVIASRCHLSQSERPWQSAKFPVPHFTPRCRKGSRQALRSDFTPLPRAPPLGKTPSGRREMSHMRQREDSWREAPERASPAEGTLRLCLAQRTARRRVHPPPLPH